MVSETINYMFWATLIPFIHHPYLRVIPLVASSMVAVSVFCPLFYPSYYGYDPAINSIDLAIVSVVYPYITYIYLNWETIEDITVNYVNTYTSLGFYILFMLYWLYYSFIQFASHDGDALIQMGNVYMSASWYIYFSTCSLLYYFICIKLSQRTKSINDWLKSLKCMRPSIEEFYKVYKQHHKAIKAFGRNWNFLVFMGFIILTYHIPIDLINVIVNNKLMDIPGIVVKTLGLAWYTYKICELNDMDMKIISYLYKHDLYYTEIAKIEKYAFHHELGLSFYGIKINGPLILKVSLLFINLVIPTIYAVLTNTKV
jgi:hypothetical protein